MERLSPADFPNLDFADLGLVPNLGYGSVEGVRAHCISGGATAVLSVAITSSQTSFDVDDATRFPAAPFIIQIAGERMLVGARSSSTFSSITRGYDVTGATAHAEGRTVFECRTSYVYMLSPEPVRGIGRVYVDGVLQADGYAAYTGRPGDEHPSWPGRAVIDFTAEAKITRQRNLGEGLTVEYEAETLSASDGDLASDTTSAVRIGKGGARKAWIAFTGSGDITTQTYEASVKNPGASDAPVLALVADTETGGILKHEHVSIPAGETRTFTIDQEGGSWETLFTLVPPTGRTLEVIYMKKTVTVASAPEDEALETLAPSVGLRSDRAGGMEHAPKLKARGRHSAWVSYAETSYGTIQRQTHTASFYNAGESDSVVSLMAVEPDGTLVATRELTIAAGASDTVTLTHSGGTWAAMTKVVIHKGEVRVDELYKEVLHLPVSAGAGAALYTASARAVIGQDITVDADWAVDDTGDYGGVGTLIERPDLVIKHFLINRMGFAAADIDTASFAAAGALYAAAISGGYRFGVVFNDITPSEFLRDLTFQCRSTIAYAAGKWYLDLIADSAPAAVRTITNGELAGKGAMFAFDKTPVVDIANSLTARYRPAYSGSADWGGLASASDPASITKYGEYPKEFDFTAIRFQAMAEDVLAHVLLQRKVPLLRVTFPVFYEHFGLAVGDTIEIDNPLYGGRKFFIEGISRDGKYRATITAVEWWS